MPYNVEISWAGRGCNATQSLSISAPMRRGLRIGIRSQHDRPFLIFRFLPRIASSLTEHILKVKVGSWEDLMVPVMAWLLYTPNRAGLHAERPPTRINKRMRSRPNPRPCMKPRIKHSPPKNCCCCCSCCWGNYQSPPPIGLHCRPVHPVGGRRASASVGHAKRSLRRPIYCARNEQQEQPWSKCLRKSPHV